MTCSINVGAGKYFAWKSFGLYDFGAVRSNNKCYPGTCAKNSPKSSASLPEENLLETDLNLCHIPHCLSGTSVEI